MFKHIFIGLFIIAGAFATVQGQVAGSAAYKIANANWDEQEVSEEILWKYYHFEDLFDSKQSITVLEVDLSGENVKIALPHVESGFVKTSEFGERSKAIAAINGSFFNTKTGGSTVFLKNNDSIYSRTVAKFTPYRENAGFAIHKDGSIAVIKRPDQGWEALDEYSTVLASGPLLIHADSLVNQKDQPFNANRHPRTAIGVTNDHKLIAVVVDGRNSKAQGATIEELSIIMDALGCNQAMNLDGGGSSTAWIKDYGVINHPTDNKLFNHQGERAVANAICFILK